MLKVAIISRWHVHAGQYYNQFKERADVQVTCMYDEDAVEGKKFADERGLPFETCLDTLLARPDVDAVCIDSPTNEHHEVLIKCAKAGKHIFTEKVLAPTVAEANDIIKAIKDAGVKFCISYPHRGMPHNLYAKKVVSEGLLGQITYMRVRNAHNGATANWLPARFYCPVQCCGGAMMDLGAHPMYLIAWLMGKPVEIASAFTNVTEGKEVEDNAVSVMKFADGAIAVSETGFVTSNSPFTLEVHGTAGSLTIVGNEVKLASAKLNEASASHLGSIKVERLGRPLADPVNMFVDGVLNDKEIVYGLDDALMLTEIMDAAYRAHKDGGFVKV